MLKKVKKYKQIFFDLDGTLLDTAPEFSKSLNNLTLNKLNKEISFEKIRNLVSDGVGALVKLGFRVSENEEEFEMYRNELLNEYAKFYLDSSLFAEVNKLLEEIEEKGIIWGIVTNKPKYLAEKIFEKFNWHKKTEILICPQDVFNKRKPDPSSLNKAIEDGGFTAEQSIYVGDNWRDSEASVNAKTNFAYADYGYGEKNSIKTENLQIILDSPSDLLKILS